MKIKRIGYIIISIILLSCIIYIGLGFYSFYKIYNDPYSADAYSKTNLNYMRGRSDYFFKIPEKEIFVKTSKLQGGRFVIYFAPDSLSLNNSKDSIEYRMGAYPQIIVDTTDIYVNSHYTGARLIKSENGDYKFEDVTDSIFYSNSGILSIGNTNFNFKVVSDSAFHSFFENDIQKPPYIFVSINTKEYNIYINEQTVKKGDIHGGWQ